MQNDNKQLTVGVMGSSQIQHLMPVIAQEYGVWNIQDDWDEADSFWGRLVAYLRGLRHCDVVYCVFCTPKTGRYVWLAHLFGKKFVGHWIGSDVRAVMEGISDPKKVGIADHNFVCFEPLQKDLESKGIYAELLPITPFNGMNFDLEVMPSSHGVLVYMPDGKEDSYGLAEMLPVMKHFSNIPFYIVANTNAKQFEGLENVHVLGRLSLEEMGELYKKVSILLRVHLSDGLSMMVLEALGKGKKVIWDHEFEHCLPGATTAEMIESIEKILEMDPEPDIAAHEFVVTTFTPENYLEIFSNAIDKI